jgi:hypothetical protein
MYRKIIEKMPHQISTVLLSSSSFNLDELLSKIPKASQEENHLGEMEKVNNEQALETGSTDREEEKMTI